MLRAHLLALLRVARCVTDVSGSTLYSAPRRAREIGSDALHLIQEGLRGVVRLPDGTAHSLDSNDFPIPVMGKTGTTSDYRDALFVGSTYGTSGITVAVRIGFDDNRPLGASETGGRTALPIFREIMLRIYKDQLTGKAPQFPRQIEDGIDQYLLARAGSDVSGGGRPGQDPGGPVVGAARSEAVPGRTEPWPGFKRF